jgi:hypothetical protein
MEYRHNPYSRTKPERGGHLEQNHVREETQKLLRKTVSGEEIRLPQRVQGISITAVMRFHLLNHDTVAYQSRTTSTANIQIWDRRVVTTMSPLTRPTTYTGVVTTMSLITYTGMALLEINIVIVFTPQTPDYYTPFDYALFDLEV